jgi:thiol-disulfide isomerase/thioredoxin
MKKLLFLAVPAMLVSCEPTQYSVEGKAAEDLEGKVVYLQNNAKEVVDSCLVEQGAFKFVGSTADQVLYTVAAGKNQAMVFLANGTEAQVDLTQQPSVVSDNGGLNDTYNAVINKVVDQTKAIRAKDDSLRALNLPWDSIKAILDVDMAALYDSYRQSITDNKDNIVGAYVLSMTARTLYGNFEVLDSVMNAVKYAKEFTMTTSYHNSLKCLAETAEGKMFTDFTGFGVDDSEVKLSDYVGKGKYVLLDFWASWCGPCKAEIPNLKELYKKFGGDKFTVVGVNISDTKEKFLESLKTEGVNYPQIFIPRDNKDNAGVLYGISGIPHIILFAPDGTIVKRNLRGEQMKQFVADQLK